MRATEIHLHGASTFETELFTDGQNDEGTPLSSVLHFCNAKILLESLTQRLGGTGEPWIRS